MNVLFLTHRLPYAPNRGDRIRAYYLLREMSRVATVSLFSLIHDDDEASHLGQVPFAADVRGGRIPRIGSFVRGALRLPSKQPLTHSLLDSPDALGVITSMIAARPPDVVVALCSSMAKFALEPPLAGLPLVVDMIDVDSAKWAHRAEEAGVLLRWVYRREAATLGAFEAVATARATATLVVNERERDALAAIAPSGRIVVVENGIDVEAFAPPGPPAAAPVVVFCGVMDYAANEEGVGWFGREVWPRVRAARPDARFAIVGGGVTRPTLELAERDPSIEVLGRVPSVQPHLWNAAVAVAPLQLARGLQNKVLEALAAGLPVVVTPAVWDGLPVEAQAGCDTAADPAAFAEAVVRLLGQSPDERRRRALSAHLDRLTWPDRLRGLEQILTEAVSSPRNSG